MLRILATGLIAAGVLVGSTAHGAVSPLVSKTDRHGDVTVAGSTDGVDPAVVDSVDLRHLTVTRQGHAVRVVVRLKQVLPLGRWIQFLSVTLASPPWSGAGWAFVATMTPQHVGSASAFYVDADSKGEPVRCQVAASKGAKVVSLVIPERCLPEDAGELSVGSVLFDRRGGADALTVYDELAVARSVDLQPGS